MRKTMIDPNVESGPRPVGRVSPREKLYEKILGGISDGFLSLDDEGHCRYANETALRIFDRTRDELIGRPLWEVLPELRGRFEETIRRGRSTDDDLTFEFFLDPNDAWYDIHLYNGDGLASVMFTDITEWKRQELFAETRGKRLVRAIGGADGGFWEMTLPDSTRTPADGRFYLSRRLTDRLRYEAETVPRTADDWFALIHPDDLPQLQRAIISVAKDNTSQFDLEYRVREKGGGYRWLHSRGSVQQEAEDGSRRLTTVTLDITRRRRSEEHQARLATIIESSNDAILSHDLEGRITTWNEGARRMFGHSAEEMIGRRLSDGLISKQRPDLLAPTLARVLRGERTDSIEAKMLQRSGQPIDVSVRLSPVVNRRGQTIGISSIHTDITRRKRMEERMHHLNHALMGVLRAFPDIVWVADHEGRIQFMNSAAEEFLADRPINEVLPADFRERVERAQQAGEDYLPTDFTGVHRIDTPSGERDFLCRVTTLDSDENGLFGATVTLQDVSELRMLDEVKSNLIGTVSHQLKTPVTSIRMSLLLLLEEKIGALNQNQRDMLSVARDEVERLLRTLNTMLDLTRFEEGRHFIERRPVPVAEILRAAVSDIAPTAAAGDVRLLSEAIAEGSVEIDYDRILHALQNLLTNAIKHSPPGGTVAITSRREEDGSVRFAVRDQGPGVAPEYREKIFEKFYRVPGNPKSGSGLGLAIVKEFVQAHSGEIGVWNVPPQGAEFFFRIP